MATLIVNAPNGKQEVKQIGEGGDYFDKARIIYDSRLDGPPSPEILAGVGGLSRVNGEIVIDAVAAKAQSDAQKAVDDALALKDSLREQAKTALNNVEVDKITANVNELTAHLKNLLYYLNLGK